MTLNFHDDKTHSSPVSLQDVKEIAKDKDYKLISFDRIEMQCYSSLLRDISFAEGCDSPECL